MNMNKNSNGWVIERWGVDDSTVHIHTNTNASMRITHSIHKQHTKYTKISNNHHNSSKFLRTWIQIMNNKFSSWRTGMLCGNGSCCFHVTQTVLLLLQLREQWHRNILICSKRNLWPDRLDPRVCWIGHNGHWICTIKFADDLIKLDCFRHKNDTIRKKYQTIFAPGDSNLVWIFIFQFRLTCNIPFVWNSKSTPDIIDDIGKYICIHNCTIFRPKSRHQIELRKWMHNGYKNFILENYCPHKKGQT